MDPLFSPQRNAPSCATPRQQQQPEVELWIRQQQRLESELGENVLRKEFKAVEDLLAGKGVSGNPRVKETFQQIEADFEVQVTNPQARLRGALEAVRLEGGDSRELLRYYQNTASLLHEGGIRTDASVAFIQTARQRLNKLLEDFGISPEALGSLRSSIDGRISSFAQLVRGALDQALSAIALRIEQQEQEAKEQRNRTNLRPAPSVSIPEPQPLKSARSDDHSRTKGDGAERSIHEVRTVLDAKPQFEAQFLGEDQLFEGPLLRGPFSRKAQQEERRTCEALLERLRERTYGEVADLDGRISAADQLLVLESAAVRTPGRRTDPLAEIRLPVTERRGA